jgi:hypothetical protein
VPISIRRSSWRPRPARNIADVVARQRRSRRHQQLDGLALQRPRQLLEPVDGDVHAPVLVVLDCADADADHLRNAALGYFPVFADLVKAIARLPVDGSRGHGFLRGLRSNILKHLSSASRISLPQPQPIAPGGSSTPMEWAAALAALAVGGRGSPKRLVER